MSEKGDGETGLSVERKGNSVLPHWGWGGSSDTLSIKSQTVDTFSLVGNYSVIVA